MRPSICIVGAFLLVMAGLFGCEEEIPVKDTDTGYKSLTTSETYAGAYNVTVLKEALLADNCAYTPTTYGTDITPSDRDDGFTSVSLPSDFYFYYYGKRQTQFNVSVNGMLFFGTAPSPTYSNTDVYGTGAKANIVAPWWDDMHLADADTTSSPTKPAGTITTYVDGSSPYRTFIIQWSRLKTFSSRIGDTNLQAGEDHNMQVRLNEKDSSIEFRYDAFPTTGGCASGSGCDNQGATVGLTDGDPTASDTISVRTQSCSPNCKDGFVPILGSATCRLRHIDIVVKRDDRMNV